MTALAMIDWPQPGQTNPQTLRVRAYGSGVSPVGFRASFLPESRVQPLYLSTNGGFISFDQRVLSPQGSQYMYTIDFGCGLTFYRKQRESFSIGYRYQHLSNGDISLARIRVLTPTPFTSRSQDTEPKATADARRVRGRVGHGFCPGVSSSFGPRQKLYAEICNPIRLAVLARHRLDRATAHEEQPQMPGGSSVCRPPTSSVNSRCLGTVPMRFASCRS